MSKFLVLMSLLLKVSALGTFLLSFTGSTILVNTWMLVAANFMLLASLTVDFALVRRFIRVSWRLIESAQEALEAGMDVIMEQQEELKRLSYPPPLERRN